MRRLCGNRRSTCACRIQSTVLYLYDAWIAGYKLYVVNHRVLHGAFKGLGRDFTRSRIKAEHFFRTALRANVMLAFGLVVTSAVFHNGSCDCVEETGVSAVSRLCVVRFFRLNAVRCRIVIIVACLIGIACNFVKGISTFYAMRVLVRTEVRRVRYHVNGKLAFNVATLFYNRDHILGQINGLLRTKEHRFAREGRHDFLSVFVFIGVVEFHFVDHRRVGGNDVSRRIERIVVYTHAERTRVRCVERSDVIHIARNVDGNFRSTVTDCILNRNRIGRDEIGFRFRERKEELNTLRIMVVVQFQIQERTTRTVTVVLVAD